MNKNDATSLLQARKLDRSDPLRKYRNRFIIKDKNTIYLDGNSLGRLPVKSAQYLRKVIEEEWGERLIRSWNECWLERLSKIAQKIAPLVGARAGEILVSDSTSVNLFKLLIAALGYHPSRRKIISDSLNFPSDLYILKGINRFFGNRYSIRIIPSPDDIHADENSLVSELDVNTSLISLSLVSYKSAYVYNMKKLTHEAKKYGALTLWDLSHAAGIMPIDLNHCGVDMAVGCTYKYLNGGPGSPAFLYIRKDLQQKINQPIWGWFGSAEPFTFHPEYQPATGIRQFACGTPYIISLSALEPALDILSEAGITKIREKSSRQTDYLIQLFDKWLAPLGFQLGSPRENDKRGSHISIRHREAYRICQAMINAKDSMLKVIPDYRRPDNIRLGVAPLYTSFEDLYSAMDRLRAITVSRIYETFPETVTGVT